MKHECYEIVKDEQKLLEFIKWLPELRDNECFYFSLFARKKYCKDLIKSNDRTQLKRFIVTDKSRIMDKIRQLEIPLGRWKLKDIEAPQESLVLYVNPNPRCMIKATKSMGKKCWDLINNNHFRIDHESLSCIQVSKSKTYWVDFDIDDKNIDLSKLNDILISECYKILETKGGYHILVNVKRATEVNEQVQRRKLENYQIKFPLNWHKAIQDTFNVDNCGDQMIPVPGCTQGEFIPKFIK